MAEKFQVWYQKNFFSKTNFTLKAFLFKVIPWSQIHFAFFPVTLACTPGRIFPESSATRRHFLFDVLRSSKKEDSF